ncbi:MAG: GNAT family N-acetyltransferase [Planctomycetes bacterium]|nr:GNAT family N-acetyltransferase [Planctomycetota bacterium]
MAIKSRNNAKGLFVSTNRSVEGGQKDAARFVSLQTVDSYSSRPWISRLQRAQRRWGALGIGKRAVLKVTRRLFYYRQYVYKHSNRNAIYPVIAGLRVEYYCQIDEVPQHIVDSILHEEGFFYLNTIRQEFEQNGQLYVGVLHERTVALMWVRKGKYIEQWFVPLTDEDYVLYGMLTFPQYRGRGLIRALAFEAMRKYGDMGGTAHIDCRVWNRSSIRAIEKLGFEKIATARPL